MNTKDYVRTAMSTIPLIFNQRQIQRTVIGGSELAAPLEKCLPVSVVVINRGARHYRNQIFQQLQGFNFKQIIFVEQAGNDYELENLTKAYPFVKFLVPFEKAADKVTVGDLINMAISEVDTEYALVLWNDTSIKGENLSRRLVEKIISEKILCQVPFLTTVSRQDLPIQMMPSMNNGVFNVNPCVTYKDKAQTLYAFDFIGIYNCEKFIQLGGFDYTIKNSYWQNLDFCFRAWLWGEEIRLASLFKVEYQEEVVPEDATRDASYLRFYLKNIVPIFRMDHADLPRKMIFKYIAKAPFGLFDAIRDFEDARLWVEKNKYRFKNDSKILIDTWGSLS